METEKVKAYIGYYEINGGIALGIAVREIGSIVYAYRLGGGIYVDVNEKINFKQSVIIDVDKEGFVLFHQYCKNACKNNHLAPIIRDQILMLALLGGLKVGEGNDIFWKKFFSFP